MVGKVKPDIKKWNVEVCYRIHFLRKRLCQKGFYQIEKRDMDFISLSPIIKIRINCIKINRVTDKGIRVKIFKYSNEVAQ